MASRMKTRNPDQCAIPQGDRVAARHGRGLMFHGSISQRMSRSARSSPNGRQIGSGVLFLDLLAVELHQRLAIRASTLQGFIQTQPLLRKCFEQERSAKEFASAVLVTASLNVNNASRAVPNSGMPLDEIEPIC